MNVFPVTVTKKRARDQLRIKAKKDTKVHIHNGISASEDFFLWNPPSSLGSTPGAEHFFLIEFKSTNHLLLLNRLIVGWPAVQNLKTSLGGEYFYTNLQMKRIDFFIKNLLQRLFVQSTSPRSTHRLLQNIRKKISNIIKNLN